MSTTIACALLLSGTQAVVQGGLTARPCSRGCEGVAVSRPAVDAESGLLKLRGGGEYQNTVVAADGRDFCQFLYTPHPNTLRAVSNHFKFAASHTTKGSESWASLSHALAQAESTTNSEAHGAAASHSHEARVEAAAKMISNRDRIRADLTNPHALSQAQLERLPIQALDDVDVVLRCISGRLLGKSEEIGESQPTTETAATWEKACRFLSARLQLTAEECAGGRTPDMSPCAGAALRAVLDEMASDAAGLLLP
jgi:hypothetical protein